MKPNVRNIVLVTGQRLISEVLPHKDEGYVILLNPLIVYQVDTPVGETTSMKPFLPASADGQYVVRSNAIISTGQCDDFYYAFYAKALVQMERNRLIRDMSEKGYSTEKHNAILKFNLNHYADLVAERFGLPAAPKETPTYH